MDTISVDLNLDMEVVESLNKDRMFMHFGGMFLSPVPSTFGSWSGRRGDKRDMCRVVLRWRESRNSAGVPLLSHSRMEVGFK